MSSPGGLALASCLSINTVFTAKTQSARRNSLITNKQMALRSLRLCGDHLALWMDTSYRVWADPDVIPFVGGFIKEVTNHD
jgi:hypothetical protein